MNNSTVIIWIVSNIILMILTYWCGRYQERINWNKLIQAGVLPRPRSARQ